MWWSLALCAAMIVLCFCVGVHAFRVVRDPWKPEQGGLYRLKARDQRILDRESRKLRQEHNWMDDWH